MTEKKSEKTQSKSSLVLVLSIIFGSLLIILIGVGVFTLYQNSLPVSEITVQGEASREIKPDEATVTLVYEEVGEDEATLNQEADRVLTEIKNYLLNEGIEEKHLVTNKNVFPDYMYEPSREGEISVERTRINATIEVTFTNLQENLSKPNEIIREAINLGATRYDGFRYAIGDTQEICEELENESIADAFETAKERVSALGGGRIIRREIQETSGCGDDYSVYPFYGDVRTGGVAEDSATTPPLELSTGTQELRARSVVIIEYR